jgi:hypothetical protein
MAVQNKFSGKAYEGTFKGGEGPVLGQSITTESETKGVFGGEGGTLKTVSGTEPSQPKGGDGMFSLKDKSYAGPGNIEFAPEDKGETSNQP